MPEQPSGQLTLRTIAMPADANPNGDIFGGWLLAQMDLAGSVLAYDQADGRVATIAIDAMSFLAPVLIGDLVSCYAEIDRIGNTSIRIKVETYATRRAEHEMVKVTEGMVTYVAIDENRKPRAVPKAR